MKFVFFGYDFSVHVAKRLIKDGHELIALFTFPCDQVFNFNDQLKTLAQNHNAPIHEDKPKAQDIENLIAEGAQLFLSCGYTYKIPPIDEAKAYGVNTHPSLLPRGRGLMPTPTIIMDERDVAGFTVHKLASDFDAGDILYQESISLSDKDTVDSYSAKIAQKSPAILSKIISNIGEYWAKATPQDQSQASTFKVPTEATRTINWDDDITRIDRVLRAFGSFGSLAMINGRKYGIFDHDIEQTTHDFPPATIIDASDTRIKIAAKGGFLTLKKFQIF